MFPAARIGDPITHDLLVVCGAIGPPPSGLWPPLTQTEFLPAAFVTCTAVCTGAITGGLAHPPPPPGPFPPIVTGSTTVQINFQPAARWTPSPDTAACGVFLGNPALAATRKTLIGG
jgi:uncharacterized Zn-binding protein involved in type VI secretion